MLIDTHCHINIMIKKTFDIPLQSNDIILAHDIIHEAQQHDVTHIINVGTSVIESINCIELAKKFNNVFAAIGIHPNDCTPQWRHDIQKLSTLIKEENRIVAIGECGLDRHYPDYNIQRQQDAFKAQIELALNHNLALIVHSRDAYDETLYALEEFKDQITRGVIHCFSYDQAFAHQVTDWGFVLGIGGVITYPKNDFLRTIVAAINLQHIILETDAPYLPPQVIRGKKNHPKHIATIAQYIAELRNQPLEDIAHQTTINACTVFGITI